MAIGSNPLRSTRKSWQTALVSRFAETGIAIIGKSRGLGTPFDANPELLEHFLV
jgi:hypothetical protein